MHAVGFSSTKFQTKPTKKKREKEQANGCVCHVRCLAFSITSACQTSSVPLLVVFHLLFLFFVFLLYSTSYFTALHFGVFFFCVCMKLSIFFFFCDISLNAFFFCRMFRCPWLLFFVFTLLTNLLGPPSREKGQKKKEKRGGMLGERLLCLAL